MQAVRSTQIQALQGSLAFRPSFGTFSMSHDRGMADDVKAWVLHVGAGGSWDDRIAFETA